MKRVDIYGGSLLTEVVALWEVECVCVALGRESFGFAVPPRT